MHFYACLFLCYYNHNNLYSYLIAGEGLWHLWGDFLVKYLRYKKNIGRVLINSVLIGLVLIIFVGFYSAHGAVWGVWFDDELTGELKSDIQVVSDPDVVMDIVTISGVGVIKQILKSNFWARHGIWVVLGIIINNKASKWWRITFDDGRIIERCGLDNWCKENGYDRRSITRVKNKQHKKHKDIVAVEELAQSSSYGALDAL